MTLLIQNARILTMAGPRPRRGRKLGDLGVIERGDVLIDGDRIAKVGQAGSAGHVADEIIDAGGRVLMPAFVDCHTHACWAGDRLDEWEQRLRGASYLEILQAGGGIMSTVRAVRSADEHDLAAALRQRLSRMLRCGSGAVEVKSGYGLSTEDELKMLRAIRTGSRSDAGSPLPEVTLTALIGHAIDPDVPGFIERTIRETLAAVHEHFPKAPIDAYCESGAWSLDDTVRLMEAAKELGHPLRVHADQFNALGMVREAVRLGAMSVDHLEASTTDDLEHLAESNTFGVILPCSGFHLDGRYASVRRLVDADGLVAMGTNYNPGSAPCPAMPMAIALAARHCGLAPAEAIAAATVNAASLLNLPHLGSIERGQLASVLLLRHTDERMLAFEFGADPIDLVVCGGRIVTRSTGHERS